MIDKLKCARVWHYTEADMAVKIDELVTEVNHLLNVCLEQQVQINELAKDSTQELSLEPSQDPPHHEE